MHPRGHVEKRAGYRSPYITQEEIRARDKDCVSYGWYLK